MDERLKIKKTVILPDATTIKVYSDEDYILQSLSLEEEQKLGKTKTQLDNVINDNKKKRNLNSFLVEQRIQGAYSITSYIATDSENLIDNWLRRNAAHWHVQTKFSSITDVFKDLPISLARSSLGSGHLSI